jgi:hypothetical protein
VEGKSYRVASCVINHAPRLFYLLYTAELSASKRRFCSIFISVEKAVAGMRDKHLVPFLFAKWARGPDPPAHFAVAVF